MYTHICTCTHKLPLRDSSLSCILTFSHLSVFVMRVFWNPRSSVGGDYKMKKGGKPKGTTFFSGSCFTTGSCTIKELESWMFKSAHATVKTLFSSEHCLSVLTAFGLLQNYWRDSLQLSWKQTSQARWDLRCVLWFSATAVLDGQRGPL